MLIIDNLNASLEPIFYTGLQKNSKVPGYLEPSRLSDYFEYRLKQNPKDLSCHLQRIQFSLSKTNNSDNNSDELFSAISDLFIILGEKGLPLRQRLFIQSKKNINQKQIELLKHHLTNNSFNDKHASLPNNCLFKNSPVNLFEICSRSKSETSELEDIFKTTDSYIENAQLDVALEYMNKHLEQDPDNEELTIKLISLYKALYHENEYADEFQVAYSKFANNLLTSQFWDNAKQFFYINEGVVKQ